MRLHELIDFEPKNSSKNLSSYTNRVIGNTDSKELGKGSFGTGYDIKSNKRLNQITKLGTVGKFDKDYKVRPVADINEDGYLSFLRMVHGYSKKGFVNPYFPVIHDLKIMKSPENALFYAVKLEKLTPLKSANIVDNQALINSLYENMFGSTVGGYHYLDILFRLNQGLIKPDTIKDEELKKALYLIKSLISSNHQFVPDIDANNIMWRITGSTPHLVIVDPIYSK